MKAILQRVRWAEVFVDNADRADSADNADRDRGDRGDDGEKVGRIDAGLLVYVGVLAGDGLQDAEKLADKVAGIRVFQDDQGKLNLCVRDVRGGILAIPNFTLAADTRKGRRPSFAEAAPPDEAQKLYEAFLVALRGAGCQQVAAGVFQAAMMIRSEAAGPVNVIVDTRDAGRHPSPRTGQGGQPTQ